MIKENGMIDEVIWRKIFQTFERGIVYVLGDEHIFRLQRRDGGGGSLKGILITQFIYNFHYTARSYKNFLCCPYHSTPSPYK